MLLFEFVGELFQFEHREPEFAPSFQLPPRITANLSSLPFPSFGYPRSEHGSHFGKQN